MTTTVQIERWATDGEVRGDTEAEEAVGHRLFHDDGVLPAERLARMIVTTHGIDPARIESLMEAGVERVLLGEAALQDAALVEEAVARHGGERLGVWLPVRMAPLRMSLDRRSNADFSTVAVSNPVPRWVIARASGETTEVDANWWGRQMLERGCSMVMASVLDPHDDDLNASAEMAEALGDHYWLEPGSGDVEELRFWVQYGQARRVVLPSDSEPETVQAALAERMAIGETA